MMSRIVSFLVILITLLLATLPTAAAEPAGSSWANVVEDTDGITRLEITKKGDMWMIKAFEWLEPTDRDLGSVRLHIFQSNDDKQMRGLAHWKLPESERHMTLRFEKEQLVTEWYVDIKDHDVYHGTQTFKRVKRIPVNNPPPIIKEGSRD